MWVASVLGNLAITVTEAGGTNKLSLVCLFHSFWSLFEQKHRLGANDALKRGQRAVAVC